MKTDAVNVSICDLGLIDEYLKMTSFLKSSPTVQNIQSGSETDRSRVGPEGGNAE